MIPTLFDLRTGKTAKGDDQSVYWWTEGNGSCDCSRAAAFEDSVVEEYEARIHKEHPELHAGASLCYGAKRFIAIDVEGDLNSYDHEGKNPVLMTKEAILMAMNVVYGR